MKIPLRSKKQLSEDPEDFWAHSNGENKGYKHMGKLYTTSEEYYRKVVKGLPLDPDDPRGETVIDAWVHADICERLARGGSYAVTFNTPKNYMYVDNWSIDGVGLYHRHPELRIMGTKTMIEAHMEWDVIDNRCTMCDKQIPGEIWMMWKLEQL